MDNSVYVFMLQKTVYVFTLNRYYFGKLIYNDAESIKIENPVIVDTTDETNFNGTININKRMIEAIIETDKG